MKHFINKRHLNISCALINVAGILKMLIPFYVAPCRLAYSFNACDSVLKLFLNRSNLEIKTLRTSYMTENLYNPTRPDTAGVFSAAPLWKSRIPIKKLLLNP
jgi:predicted glutamine amidotransferase